MSFKELLNNGYIVLDGAMGTMLQKRGLNAGEIPEFLNITNGQILVDIAYEYAAAGANVICANTFGANSRKLVGTEYTVKGLVQAGIAHTRAGIKQADSGALVAVDIGPIGEMLEPTGTVSFEEAYDIYKEIALSAIDADVAIIETMTDLYEVRAALLAVKENTDLPVICMMTFEPNGRTFTGCDLMSMATTLEALGADAIGINCSLGPDKILPMAKELLTYTSLPIAIKPNAGLPSLTKCSNDACYDIDEVEFAHSIEEMLKAGVQIVGGCCGTTPEYIKLIKQLTKKHKLCRPDFERTPRVCSASKTVTIDGVRIIGERINPTGKKLLKEALINQNMDYILNQALQQINGGAHILDVNVGLPDINETIMMQKVVKAVQSITDTPLQIDSSDPSAIEAGLRVYNGKAIVNSVNGEQEVLDKILPIVKKYGASVVGLTLDKNGIPPKAEERFAIASHILSQAQRYGIPKEDVYIDCLTLTASAQQEAVIETLKAVRMVKEQLGLKTVLGVSNISFGLPNRELINHSFLTMAMSYGLDLPIINPNISVMTDAIHTFNLLTNADKDAKKYVDVFGGQQSNTSKPPVQIGEDISVQYAIINGLKADAIRATEKLLETIEPMEIVNTLLIPSLDIVGDGFGKGEIFLPQLIQAAGAVEGAFAVIKQKMPSGTISKGKIVLATVKGDIHDIGKNIVKILLENYGFTVIDLGRDVPPQSVVDAAKSHNVSLVGLSALMTTTLKSMEDTINLIRENQLNCKIVVGGAVLTGDYAKKIGADFYAGDAKETVDIAREIYGA